MDFKALLHQISQIYQKLSLKQKIVAGSSIVLVVAFLVFLTLYKSKSDSFAGYSVLFENISPSDSALIVDQLNKDGIKYKLANEGTILVPTSDVYKERIAVATLGIPKESKIGFEIFDKQEFGATDAEQRVKFQRALEGELARTIESLSSIQKATVRIAIPKESVFTERQALPTASIVVELKPGVSLNAKQIFGIKNLVAASVTNLSTENVKIVNQDGVALGDEDGEFDSDAIAQQIRYKREFDKKDTKSEVYDPNNVVRSESNIEEKRQGSAPNEVGGVPGAVSNIGPVQGLDDSTLKEQYNKSSQQTNYEISKKVTNVKGQFASINRVSAAVVIDGIYKSKKDSDGKPTGEFEFTPLTKEQRESITNLIKQSIGYNQNRGDEVSLDNFEFKTHKDVSASEKMDSFMNSYVVPFLPIFKYLFAALLLYVFYKKVIVPFMQKMLEETKEEEEQVQNEFEDIETDAEDTLEKFKAARKKVEEQLGLGGEFNEDELKYDVLLEKMRTVISERSEEIAALLQDMVKNDSDFNMRKEI